MKILYVNWAPLWRGAEIGGGVNLYSQSMAVKLAQLGHELYAISSGYGYNLKNRVYIKKAIDYMGVKNYEIFNAPNMAPGFFNFENPLNDVSEPLVEEAFEQFLKWLRPDVVHFHNIEGFSAHCIPLAKQNGARVIFSLHNYHPVCNQIYLLYKDRDICKDFDNGKKCLNCIHPPSYSSEILKRRSAYHIHRLPWGDRIWRKLETISRFKAVHKMAGVIQSCGNKKNKERQERHLLYAKRRKYIIEALNQAHQLHAVSEFVKEYYIEMGVYAHLLKTCHIGNKMAEQKPLSLSESSKFNGFVDIIFLGIASYPKGLPFFLETLMQMDRGVLKQIRLHVHARGGWILQETFAQLSELVHSINFHDGYDFNALPEILSGKDFGIVPPLWYDNAPQVVFEMLAMKVPVIGAKIGGIPDFVKHMDNGLLFEAGNKKDLADKLETAVMDKGLVMRLKNNISPMKTLDQHVDELADFYRDI